MRCKIVILFCKILIMYLSDEFIKGWQVLFQYNDSVLSVKEFLLQR